MILSSLFLLGLLLGRFSSWYKTFLDPCSTQLASCLMYARTLLEYVNFIVWVRSVNKMVPSVKFAEYNVLTFFMLCQKC